MAALFTPVLVGRLERYHGNPTGFILFGRQFTRYTHPPRGAPVLSPSGYDGQFFYLQARDPLLLENSTLASFRAVGQAFRMQRMAYPALAYLAAAGQLGALPWSLLLINLVIVLAVTAGCAGYARGEGLPGWWALLVGLLAGLLTGTLRDLSDPLAVAAMAGGLIAWQRRRAVWAGALLALAVLAREPMALAAVAVALEVGLEIWRAPATAWHLVRRAAPALAIPACAFVIWHAYIDARYGSTIASSSLAFLPPFQGLWHEVRHALSDPSRRDGAWELAYIAVMSLGIAAALLAAWRRRTAQAVAAALFGLLLVVLVFGDPWSYTRLSAPLFGTLALVGVAQRDRPALAVCAAGAAMTVLAPLAPWFGAI